LTLLVGGFFVFLLADNSTAGYQQKIEACIAARLPSGAGPKSITDYICPEGQVVAPHDVAYQVVLDLEFRKIDQEIQKELLAFQWDKVKKSTDVSAKLVDWFDMTGPNFEKSYTAKYQKICQDIQSEGNPINAVLRVYSGGVTTDGQTAEFLYDNNACMALVAKKVAAYRDIGYLIGLKNINQTFIEDKEKFIDVINEEYQNFLMQWTIYIGELSRIKSKWNIKTKIQNE
jgi:hypothetical protein